MWKGLIAVLLTVHPCGVSTAPVHTDGASSSHSGNTSTTTTTHISGSKFKPVCNRNLITHCWTHRNGRWYMIK